MRRGMNRDKVCEGQGFCGLLLAVTALCFLGFAASSAPAATSEMMQASVSGVTTQSAILNTGIDLAERRQVIEGVAPATLYRIVAKDSEGEAKAPDRARATFLVQPPFPPCPNDRLRAGPAGNGPGLGLPDCRAYEQASPVDKNGTTLLGELPPLRASVTGDAVGFESFRYYLATRGADDWSTQDLLPHGKAGDTAKVSGWTRDFLWSFSRAGKSVEKKQAYLARSSADGSLETVVDYTDLGKVNPFTPGTFFFAGAATDGSTVYFEATGPNQGELSPDVAPNRNNLYAWDHATGELHLAGVLPDGSTPPGGSLAGPYDWVRGTDRASRATGGAQRAYYTQDDHAISNDGSRAFFTTGDTGQIYLRENATRPDASTQHVSKSQRTSPDALGSRPAAFMAATPDGSHAFFTSSEKLTNDASTGPEISIAPAVAQADVVDGNPLDIDCLPTSALGVTVDDEYIYWTDPATGTIGRAALGCEPESIEGQFIEVPEIETKPGGSTPPNPRDLAVNATHIYWTNSTDGKKGTGTIGRAGIEGDNINPECVKGASRPEGIDVNATHVYWTNPIQVTDRKGTIGRAELDCEEANQEAIAPAGLNQEPRGLALGASQVYWTVHVVDFASVARSNLDGSEQRSIGIGPFSDTLGIAVDSAHVYWSDGDDDSIGLSNLDFSEEDKKFIEGAGSPAGLAVDATHLYWAANQEVPPNPGNDLYRYEADTGELLDVVGDGPVPNGAEVRGVLGVSGDGSRAYFVANGVLTDIPNPQGESAAPGTCSGAALEGSGSCNLYLWDEGDTGFEFVARLNASGGTLVNDALNWAATSSGAIDDSTHKTARLSADGSVLVFRSTRQLTDYENEGVPHFYRYDAPEHELSCLSCNPTGASPGAAPVLGTISASPSTGVPTSVLTRNLSADGSRFFFETTEALVGADTNGLAGCLAFEAGADEFPSCQDVYMWEKAGQGSCESETQNGGCLYLLSTGTEPKPSFFGDASASGADAFLVTSSPGLAFQDQDELFDVYVARVGGGLRSQNEPPGDPCRTLDSCRPVPPPPPAIESPSAFVGPGDPPSKRRACPKGKRKARVKGKMRCVSKRPHRTAKRQ